MATSLKQPHASTRRPVYRNIHITQIASYRLPAAGWVSILHRISGAFAFLMLPFAIWMFDRSVTSEVSWEQFRSAFAAGLLGLPGWLWKLVAFALVWAYLLHFFAGLRHLWMDMTHQVGLSFGRISAWVAMVAGTVLAFAVGARLFLA